MTSKPDDVRVPRELLERLFSDEPDGYVTRMNARQELLALLAQSADQQGEPICYQARHSAPEPWFFTDKPGYWEWRAIYAQPATAKVVLPGRMPIGNITTPHHDWSPGVCEGWNACLDEVAKLNGIQS